MQLYPLKFYPIFKEKIWGGNKIRTELNKDTGNLPNCGESWELSGVTGNISTVKEGPLAGKLLTELMSAFRHRLVGEHVFEKYAEQFPLLIKFIDARDDLSVQVHPDDRLAAIRHHSTGKTEMWYIIKADKGSSLISGFNRQINKKEYREYLNRGDLQQVLNVVPAADEDVFYIPAGRVHTIGKGLLLAEIQQTSDITYRIYDFDRTDAAGKKRELHTEESVDAIDFSFSGSPRTPYDKNVRNQVQPLVQSPYFSTNRLFLDRPAERNYGESGSFGILIGLEGNGRIRFDGGETNISRGEVVLIPASLGKIGIHTEKIFKALETFIPE